MAVDTEDLEGMGWKPGRETKRLVLKAADAALACSIPKEEVLERLEAVKETPEQFTGDLLFADVAHRIKK
ncbi:MAG: hypothetical protein ACR2IE_04465 [Candidatus Sumerlaeaceae bacterium]